jgi:hypothetical protein
MATPPAREFSITGWLDPALKYFADDFFIALFMY